MLDFLLLLLGRRYGSSGEKCSSSSLHGGGTAISFKCVNPTQMHEGSTCDGSLIASSHDKRVNPTQMCEGSVSDRYLIASVHVKRVNSRQMHKGNISNRYLIA